MLSALAVVSTLCAADPLTIDLIDARSGAPIAGARVIAAREPVGEWPACSEDLLTGPPPPNSAIPGTDIVERSSDKAGRATFSAADVARLAPPAQGCPPGAPCIAPRQYATSLFIVATGHLSLRLGPTRDRGRFDAPRGRVALVSDTCAVGSPQAAVAAVEKLPHWKAWVANRPYKPTHACLGRDGSWRVFVDSIGWPSYLPNVEARVNATSAQAAISSCPGQGTPMKFVKAIDRGAELTDEVAGHTFHCVPGDGPACGAFHPDHPLAVVGTGRLAVPGCDQCPSGTFVIGIGSPDPPIKTRCLLECRRVR